MSSPNETLVSSSQLRVMQINVLALVLGLLTFGVVAIVQQANRPGPPAPPVYAYIVAAFAALAVVASFLVPRLMLAAQRHLPVPEGGWAARYQVQALVGLAILEGAGFFGLVFYFIEGDVAEIAVAATMIALMGLRFPTRDRVERWIVRQREQAENGQPAV